MEIDFDIQNNCSEATIRVLTDGQDKKKVKALLADLDKMFDENSDWYQSEWEDEPAKLDDYYEGYFDTECLFGKMMIKISGDAPYNNGDAIFALIEKHLPKAETDYTEP